MCQIGDFKRTIHVPKSKPIVAYREWDTYSDGKLYPRAIHNHGNPWVTPRKAKADERPHGFNHKGLWAYKARPTPRAFSVDSRRFGGKKFSRHLVQGKVALWGTVCVHKRGYRAEFAKVLALTKTGATGCAKDVAKEYRFKVIPA